MHKKIKLLPGLTIAIPAYNEEENLGWVVKNIIKEAPEYLGDYEIVIVDDGSTDRTGIVADKLEKHYKQVRVIHQPNGGYGVAMLRGIAEAKKEFVCYMPADGQFLVRDMQFCLPYMREADLILGARGSRADYTTYRLILSYTYLIVLRVLFGITFQDVNWLTIWRTKIVQKLPVISRGIFMLAEIVVRFQKKGLRVVEAPSFYRPRRSGQVKNAKFSIALQTLIDALRVCVKLRK